MKALKSLLVILIIGCLSSATMAQDWANLEKYAKDNSQLAAPLADENRVVFMGNSITENWKKYHASFFSENPYICRGISGQVSSQMLLRFRPDVINLQAKVVVISAGTNDIAENKGPISIEAVAGNIFSMAELAKANGIQVILTSVLPASSFSWRKGIEPVEKIVLLNQLIQAYAQKNNLVYVDYYKSMVNKEKGLKKEYGRDTVHPNIDGYKVMEKLVKKAIKKALKDC
jgi:alpha-L-fucosidase